MANVEKKITNGDLRSSFWRLTFLQASWNYERMQNVGWAYAMIPAIKRLYGDDKAERSAALKRHLEFFNTHPYVAAPVLGVEIAMEEQRANGAEIDDATLQGVKIGMMGPLAGVGDPIFWGTARPVIGAFAASLAMSRSIAGPIVFFVLWNALRMAFLWYTQKMGYQQGTSITKNLAGGALQKITLGASILGMFIMGVLVPRWTTMKFPLVVSKVKMTDGTTKVTTLDNILNQQLLPGIAPLALTFLTIWLLRKKVNALVIILMYFVLGIVLNAIGVMGK
ncbi:PTS system mannose/fructose/sorbose family transporter subunit IID [Leuconostoc fallax]|uniref:Uncharacterized protein n=1 Tax=Leuconostoc fallax TaxID=1251 RepID=A0A4R5NAS7_9LACO|nr:PTS system mannose/fructose/sorbose family transporter subunit IID [Leuconostoc fallax]MBU7455045.1 PTS mannose/fructose/sorbose transporter family subunit IID [Leuconostoc fallax]TDG69610.1 hypothetical protein C5L23_001072 [Leuconostoc fallax]